MDKPLDMIDIISKSDAPVGSLYWYESYRTFWERIKKEADKKRSS